MLRTDFIAKIGGGWNPSPAFLLALLQNTVAKKYWNWNLWIFLGDNILEKFVDQFEICLFKRENDFGEIFCTAASNPHKIYLAIKLLINTQERLTNDCPQKTNIGAPKDKTAVGPAWANPQGPHVGLVRPCYHCPTVIPHLPTVGPHGQFYCFIVLQKFIFRVWTTVASWGKKGLIYFTSLVWT